MKTKKNANTYKWAMYALMTFTYFFVFFHRLSSGVVKADLVETFALTGTGFSNLNSMYFYAYLVMQIPSGILADTLGARKTVTFGCLVMSLGSILFGLSPNILSLMLARMLVGLGASVIFISILKIQSRWFLSSKFALLTGITTFIGNLGGAVAQAPLAFLVALLSWRMTFVSIGAFTLVLAILSYLIIRNNPEELGFENIVPQATNQSKPNVFLALKNIATNKYSYSPFFINCFFVGSSMALTAWGVSYISHCYNITWIIHQIVFNTRSCCCFNAFLALRLAPIGCK